MVLNSTIKLNGNLDATMRPDLKTLTGIYYNYFNNTKFYNSTLLTALGSNLKFIDAAKSI
jgi:hypothetical protein